MREMKDSGIEWIGEIPKEWEIIRMKNMIISRDGGAWGEEKSNDENDVICLRIADFDYQCLRFKDTNELTIRNYKPEVKNKLLLLKDDILIEKSGGGEKTPVGRAVIFDKKYEALFANFMERLRTRNNVNPKYFLYILTAFYQNRHMLNYIKQTTGIQNLDISSLLSIERSPFSSISEQQKISAYLDEKCTKIDTIIEKQQKIIEKLKAYKLSLITETVTKGLNPDVKMKDSGVEWIGKIPENWNMIRIKWLLDERKERSEKGIEEPLSMSQKYGLIPTKEMDMIPNVASTYVGAKIVYSNDLVFNKLKAHLGVFSVSRYYGLVSPDYAVYYSTGKAELKYLEYLFKTPQCILEFRKKSSGVADGLTRLYTSGLFSIYCPFPLKSEQQAIANYLDKKCTAIDSAIAKKQALIEKLTEYKKSLIYEVVTGKKEV
ncbi:MAG: restriction endonuclease subunit S [Alistipes senegalensis]|nr:restriction endonuclease subunit S [Alistipes senegalensis]